MKIIEAMKKVKANREKVADLQEKIKNNCAHLSHETSPYGDKVADKVQEWAQSCFDLNRESVELLTRISKTNSETFVDIEINGKMVNKSISEWIWRRREFAALDQRTWSRMTDRGLQEGSMKTSTGDPMEVKIVRNYDAQVRDDKLEEYAAELSAIDPALEIVNAITDLVE
jgi:hypothetical protein